MYIPLSPEEKCLVKRKYLGGGGGVRESERDRSSWNACLDRGEGRGRYRGVCLDHRDSCGVERDGKGRFEVRAGRRGEGNTVGPSREERCWCLRVVCCQCSRCQDLFGASRVRRVGEVETPIFGFLEISSSSKMGRTEHAMAAQARSLDVSMPRALVAPRSSCSSTSPNSDPCARGAKCRGVRPPAPMGDLSGGNQKSTQLQNPENPRILPKVDVEPLIGGLLGCLPSGLTW